MTSAQRGRFIVFEGGDGAGKTTQLRLLADALEQKNVAVVRTREPGGSVGGEAIRQLLVTGEPERWDGVTEALLLFAARRDHVQRTILPALTRGAWVLCDRFTDSTLAYQHYARGVDRRLIEQLRRLTIGRFKPDLTVILDIDAELGLRRAAARSGAETRYEKFDAAFHENLRRGFLALAAKAPKQRRVIDGGRPMREVQNRIRSLISERFKLVLDPV